MALALALALSLAGPFPGTVIGISVGYGTASAIVASGRRLWLWPLRGPGTGIGYGTTSAIVASGSASATESHHPGNDGSVGNG